MLVRENNRYQSSKNKLAKNDNKLLAKINSAQELLSTNHNDSSLSFKKIECKRDKNRHSIRVPGTQNRILFIYENDIATLLCVCKHDFYEYNTPKSQDNFF